MLFAVFMMVIISSACVCPRELRYDPATRRSRVLYVGDTLWRTWRDLAYDPFLRLQPVPATMGHFPMEFVRKSMRLYIPRTHKDYAAKVDLLILSDTDHFLFTTEQQVMFSRGVIEEGQGLIMAGGFEAFGGAGWGSSWKGSSVEEALPVECVDAKSWELNPFFARPHEGSVNHPFITSLPWKSMPTFSGMNVVIPKLGSIILLEATGVGISSSQHEPVLIYSEMGKGSSLAHAPDWNPGWGATVMEEWDYYGDYLVNMAYLTVGMAIPQDLELSHLVRTELADYQLQSTVTVSLLEFAEKFGGNVVDLEERLGETGLMKVEADELYLGQDYDSVLEVMEEVRKQLLAINEDAIKVKDQALFWVYFIEWLSVTGTLLVCGFVLWTLMVRRRAYRVVKTTRLRSRLE